MRSKSSFIAGCLVAVAPFAGAAQQMAIPGAAAP